jgi:hypothetical protein
MVNEDDPTLAEPTVDIYDPANGFPVLVHEREYDVGFLIRAREAQLRRVEATGPQSASAHRLQELDAHPWRGAPENSS